MSPAGRLLGVVEPKATRADLRRRINAIAVARHAISRRDLLALGMTSDEIRFQLETVALVRLHRGVYGIGGAPRTREQRWSAAVLACGPTAALSHLSAAALWALTETDPVVIDTSIAGRSKRTRRGVRVHRPSRLEPEDTTDHQGIRTTTVDRTLIDLAVVVSTRTLERLLDEAQHLKLLDTDNLDQALLRNEGRAGVPRLRRVLSRHQPGSTRTRSFLEEAFLLLTREAGLPQPLVNEALGPYTIDFLWRPDRVAVETDGRSAHERIAARERDYRRDAWLHAQGYLPLRFSYEQVTSRPAEVLAALRPKLQPM